jgi:hypothetical protein
MMGMLSLSAGSTTAAGKPGETMKCAPEPIAVLYCS